MPGLLNTFQFVLLVKVCVIQVSSDNINLCMYVRSGFQNGQTDFDITFMQYSD